MTFESRLDPTRGAPSPQDLVDWAQAHPADRYELWHRDDLVETARGPGELRRLWEAIERETRGGSRNRRFLVKTVEARLPLAFRAPKPPKPAKIAKAERKLEPNLIIEFARELTMNPGDALAPMAYAHWEDGIARPILVVFGYRVQTSTENQTKWMGALATLEWAVGQEATFLATCDYGNGRAFPVTAKWLRVSVQPSVIAGQTIPNQIAGKYSCGLARAGSSAVGFPTRTIRGDLTPGTLTLQVPPFSTSVHIFQNTDAVTVQATWQNPDTTGKNDMGHRQIPPGAALDIPLPQDSPQLYLTANGAGLIAAVFSLKGIM